LKHTQDDLSILRVDTIRRMSSGAWTIAALRVVACVCFFSLLLRSQENSWATLPWQQQVRRYAQAQDWNAAFTIVDREIARSPEDMDVRAWHARLWLWSGRVSEAEGEFLQIVSISPKNPDYWLDLANVYSREGRSREAERELERALELDPARADLHAAHARALRALNRWPEARLEYRHALELDPRNEEARLGLRSVAPVPKHELRLGSTTDLFSFADANHQLGLSLNSHWTSRWATTAAADWYQWAGISAEKLTASLTAKQAAWGALTLGGASAHDQGVIPRDEAFFAYSQGWRLHAEGSIRGVETDFEQHWYWYSSARILTLSPMVTMYLPDDCIWSLRLTEARSDFSGSGAEWRPSGFTRLGFPLVGNDFPRILGSVLFATGTENFAQADQIGRFSSQTYGGSVQFRFMPSQDVTGVVAYQKRTNGGRETSFALSYGIRF
jgi:tetratricopeptide (TPR) repeat protein